jgi:glycosyltransferase involved in cell wall biosynthesis
MAWNWCRYLARRCKLHIITEGEFKSQIEAALLSLPEGKNMHFHYNPVSDKVRRMCWNQGDWRFYRYYRKWQQKTLTIACKIVASNRIDIIHQLNMIGFREPGYLWKIKDIPFVWGPIGGIKMFPVAYLQGARLEQQVFYRLKNMLNSLQLRFDRRVCMALGSAALLISAIPDTYRAIKEYHKAESVTIPETGCFINRDNDADRFHDPCFHILWAGKFDFRKQLPLALRAIAATGNDNIVLDVFGSGNKRQIVAVQRLARELNIDGQVVWHGNRPHHEVMQEMQRSQLFFFTSVSEDTSTVVLEAISCCTPILCFDINGMGHVVDGSIGIKIGISNPKQSVADFAEQIQYLYHNRSILKTMSINSLRRQEELSWERKAEQVILLYETILTDRG